MNEPIFSLVLDLILPAWLRWPACGPRSGRRRSPSGNIHIGHPQNVRCELNKWMPLTNLPPVEGSARRLQPGLVNFGLVVAYLFCLDLPVAFMQPGRSFLAEPYTPPINPLRTSYVSAPSSSLDLLDALDPAVRLEGLADLLLRHRRRQVPHVQHLHLRRTKRKISGLLEDKMSCTGPEINLCNRSGELCYCCS